MVIRTRVSRREWPPLLRKQHPKGHEQTALNFAAEAVNLFVQSGGAKPSALVARTPHRSRMQVDRP